MINTHVIFEKYDGTEFGLVAFKTEHFRINKGTE